jgi:dihydrofolate reductase
LYLSEVKGEFEGDTYFPEFNKDNYEIIEEIEFDDFVFKKYKRIN